MFATRRHAFVGICLAALGLVAPSAPASGEEMQVRVLAGSTRGGGHLDGVVTEARFSLPWGIARTSDGSYYVADTGNHVIRRVRPDGEVSTVAGKVGVPGYAGGRGEAVRFNVPRGIASDGLDNLYVADTYNHVIRKIAPNGDVTVLAGQPTRMGTSDGGVAAAQFTYPYDVAVAPSGVVYVADTVNHTIRAISPSGVSTIAGSARSRGSSDGFGSQARFRYPYGLAVGPNGDVFVADTDNHTVRKVTPEGRVTTIAGSPEEQGETDGVGVDARFEYPWRVTVAPTGVIYVSDTGNDTIRAIEPNGTVSTIAGKADTVGNRDGQPDEARFSRPSSMVALSASELMLVDRDNHIVRKITVGQRVTTFAGSRAEPGFVNALGTDARFFYPTSIAMAPSGDIFVGERSHVIRRITPEGRVQTFAGFPDSPGSTDGSTSTARFRYPEGVAFDPLGNLIVADTGNHTIRQVTPGGLVTTIAGKAGTSGFVDGYGVQARFDTPVGVAVDDRGYIYVGDNNNHAIRLIEPGSLVSTIAGDGYPGDSNGVGTSASFYYPAGVAVDADRNVYVADDYNDCIRKITPSGQVTTFAGKAGESGSQDGSSTAARFSGPGGLDVSEGGILYVADSNNHTIRRIEPNGSVSTVAGLPLGAGNQEGKGVQARFCWPLGLTVDSRGNVIVTDTYSHVVKIAEPPPPDPPTIVSFVATPTKVEKGQPVTLTWSTKNATAATLSNYGGTIGVSGSVQTTPAQTTEYILTATGPGGSVSASVTVEVTVPPLPVITSFNADPNPVEKGQGVRLSWTSTDAVTAMLDGHPTPLGPNDSTMVWPTETTVYKLTVAGRGGGATATVEVRVVGPRIRPVRR